MSKHWTDLSLGLYVSGSSGIMDIHPIYNWIAIYENGIIYIWDYDRKTVVSNITELENIRKIYFVDNHVIRWRGHSGTLKHSWIVALGDTRIAFINYFSNSISYVPLASLDSKTSTCLEIVGVSLAIGCSDGSIKFLKEFAVSKVLQRGVHTRAITNLLAFKNGHYLVSASADGAICVWDLNGSNESPITRLNQSRGSPHETGTLLSASINHHTNQLTTVGTDKLLAVWNLNDYTEIIRYKALKDNYKKLVTGAEYIAHAKHTQSTVIAYAGTSQVLVIDTLMYTLPREQQDYSSLIDFRTMLPNCQAMKILSIKVHPLLSHLFFVATNQGVYTVIYEPRAQPGASFHPNFVSMHNAFCYLFSDATLYKTNFWFEQGRLIQDKQVQYTASKHFSGLTQITTSPTGKYLSVFNQRKGLYEILKLTTGEPVKIKTGHTKKLQWHFSKDTFAVLSPMNEDGTIGSFASYVPEGTLILLLIFEIHDNQVALIYRGDSIPNPSTIFGGLYLTVCREEATFLDWETMKEVGTPYFNPTGVYWHGQYVIIAYSDEFYICNTQPSFHFMKKVSAGILAGFWFYTVFFYTTAFGIYWIEPQMAKKYQITNYESDQIKPPGQITLVTLFQDSLLLVDVLGQLREIKLEDPLLQIAVLTASERIDKAKEIADRHESLHKPIAQLFAAYGHASEALTLSNIDQKTKLAIALKHDVPIPFDDISENHINTILTHCRKNDVRR